MSRRIPLALTTVLLLVTTDRLSADDPTAEKPDGFLFAHMTKEDYGRLYYAISTDGLHWRMLNKGRRVMPQYRGHPDIMRGHDGRWILVGNPEPEDQTAARFWVSANLAHWKHLADFKADMSEFPGFDEHNRWHGAPKLFYDRATKQYLLTWHFSNAARLKENPENYWSGMRTFCVTSPDLATFSPVRRLFDWDMATIDVIVRKEDGHYYAIIKDERYPSFDWPTGKAIRIARSDHLTGPWSEPGPKVSPNFREAPMLIPRTDGTGWLLYFEQYPGLAYGAATAPRLAGPWFDLDASRYSLPPNARHGCMVPLGKPEFDALNAAEGVTDEGYGLKEDPMDRFNASSIPVIDFHVHLRGGMTLEKAIHRQAVTGIKVGVLKNMGKGWPIETDDQLREFLQQMHGQPVFVGVQVNDRDWMDRHCGDLLKRLHFVLADTMIMPMPDDDGEPVKLWLTDQYTIDDPEAWMKRYVRHNLQVLAEPVTILANPTYLPPAVEDRYDELWTDERMRQIIRAAIDNNVALEINARSGLPRERFIRMAKKMGAKFTFGSNNFDDRPIDMSRCFQAIDRYRLRKDDMYVPAAKH
ncbi:MAG: hypothetical protein A2V70_12150 [Planctomycetes bacterium RBG_13_63_9]|nr:MAG: hypothetical protein A2V70_12150 [Planctomycetes bacterium RBG_13_63_9]